MYNGKISTETKRGGRLGHVEDNAKAKTQAIMRKTCLLMLFLAMHTNIHDMKLSTVALVRVH
jgi:hypothetical protein